MKLEYILSMYIYILVMGNEKRKRIDIYDAKVYRRPILTERRLFERKMSRIEKKKLIILSFYYYHYHL